MGNYLVTIGAVRNVFYSATMEISADSPEAAEEAAIEQFYYDPSCYEDSSEDFTIQEIYSEIL